MADASSLQTEETPGQRQARLRRERRDAKIKSEGATRLEKITKVSGRQNLPNDLKASAPSAPASSTLGGSPQQAQTSSSQAGQDTQSHASQPSEADIRALLRQGAPQPGIDVGNNGHDQNAQEEDPMQRLLAQILGGGPAGDAANSDGTGNEGSTDLPPNLASLLGMFPGGSDGPDGKGQTMAANANNQDNRRQDYAWKILHAAVAVTMGFYVTMSSAAFTHKGFGGSRDHGRSIYGEESRTPVHHDKTINVFWIFATTELLLQSARYLLERGKLSSGIGGTLGMVASLLPRPWKTYLMLAARYSGIWSTIVEDALMLVFVVGMICWWYHV